MCSPCASAGGPPNARAPVTRRADRPPIPLTLSRDLLASAAICPSLTEPIAVSSVSSKNKGEADENRNSGCHHGARAAGDGGSRRACGTYRRWVAPGRQRQDRVSQHLGS